MKNNNKTDVRKKNAINNGIQKLNKIFGNFVISTLLSNKGVLLLFIHPDFRNLRNGTILYYKEPERSRIFDWIGKLKKSIDLQLGYNEAYQIYRTVQSVDKIKGDIAEIGVFEGGSARIICEVKKRKTLHLFDTFEGLPKVSALDSAHFKKGQYNGPLKTVKKNLSLYKNIHYYKGLFPFTSGPVKNKKFSFVHLDVDIYSSTKACLKFFYPRMSRGGVIMSHDYISANGVRKAFDEFFEDKKEPIIEMSGSQCLIVKI